jgi:hypothetical protein
VLPLECKQKSQSLTPAPAGLVQALADLLLEAFGTDVALTTNRKGARDESKDHA